MKGNDIPIVINEKAVTLLSHPQRIDRITPSTEYVRHRLRPPHCLLELRDIDRFGELTYELLVQLVDKLSIGLLAARNQYWEDLGDPACGRMARPMD